MPCGNKEHNLNKNIIHACGICKYWTINCYFDKSKLVEPCITCKKGNCQFQER